MNYIDIVLGILLLVGGIRGIMNGFLVELASLAALILGIWGAIYLSHYTGNFLIKTFSLGSETAGPLAFLITFVVIIVVVHLLGKALTKVVEAMQLGLLNRLAGLLFGILKTALILSVLLFFFDEMDQEAHLLEPKAKEQSQVYEPLKNLVPTLLPFIDFKTLYNDSVKLEHEMDKTV